jgi:hypothetical protein
VLPKYNDGTSVRGTFSLQKGKKEGVTGLKKVQNPTGQTKLNTKAGE